MSGDAYWPCPYCPEADAAVVRMDRDIFLDMEKRLHVDVWAFCEGCEHSWTVRSIVNAVIEER